VISSTTQPYSPAQIEALRQMGRDKGLADDVIEAKLTQAGVLSASPGGDQWGRHAGLAGRTVVQGLSGLNNMMPWNMPQQIGAQVAGLPQQTAPADQMGLPQPETPGERMAVAGGEAGVMGAVAGPMAGVLGAASGVAGQGAAESGAGPLGQLAASAAVGLGAPVVGTILAGATRSAVMGAATRREAARQSAALIQAGDPSAPVTLGQVAQTGRARLVEGGLRNMPGANMVFADALERQAQSVGQRVQGLATGVAPIKDKAAVGKIVQRGIEQGFVHRFRSTSKKLYDDVETYVAPESPVIMGSTTRLMAEQNDLVKMAPAGKDLFATPFMQKWGNDFADLNEQMPDGVPYQVVKAMRTRVGNILDGSEAVPDVNIAEAGRLYTALSDDMARTVGEVGGEAGLQAWTRASTFWKAGKDRLNNVLQPLLDKKTPELAYNALMAGTKDAGTVLRTTMRSLGPEERKIVTSSVVGKMGLASPGAQNAAGDVFSADVFLSRWAGLSPIAKGALFEGVSPTISKNLDDLVKAAESIKSANKVMRNPSGSATNVAFLAITGALGGTSPKHAAMGLGVAAAGHQLAKRVFTNPKMVNWLVKTTKFPIGMIGPQLVILGKESREWDAEDRDLAMETIETLGSIDWGKQSLEDMIAEHAAR
jgi:hypothetical protein